MNPPLNEYINLQEAAKMADRTNRTIYNWLQSEKIQGKKKDENNEKSKWLILRSSLMGYLATEAEPNPPRKSSSTQKVEIEAPTLPNEEDIKSELVDDSRYETLLEDMKKLKGSYEIVIEQLKSQNQTLEQQVKFITFQAEQKEEMIEFLKQMQPSMDNMRKEYERKIEELTVRAFETEKELSVLQTQYEIESTKGLLARIFSPAQELKQLVDHSV